VPYQYTDNAMFVRDYTIKLLGTSFPNMITAEVRIQLQEFGCAFDRDRPLTSFRAQVTKFVEGLLSSKHDLPSFKNHIRDFLVQSKEFSAQVSASIFLLLAFPVP
jgi:exportin-1